MCGLRRTTTKCVQPTFNWESPPAWAERPHTASSAARGGFEVKWRKANKCQWSATRLACYAHLAPSAPAAHRILMRLSRAAAARSTSRAFASSRAQRRCGLRRTPHRRLSARPSAALWCSGCRIRLHWPATVLPNPASLAGDARVCRVYAIPRANGRGLHEFAI